MEFSCERIWPSATCIRVSPVDERHWLGPKDPWTRMTPPGPRANHSVQPSKMTHSFGRSLLSCYRNARPVRGVRFLTKTRLVQGFRHHTLEGGGACDACSVQSCELGMNAMAEKSRCEWQG